MQPKLVGHLSFRLLGPVVFPPNLMPLLSCDKSCPKGSLSELLFLWVGLNCWGSLLSFGSDVSILLLLQIRLTWRLTVGGVIFRLWTASLLLFDASTASRFVFWCANPGCALTQPHTCAQASNQLGTPGGAKSFLRGAEIFWTMSNIFKLCPTHFFQNISNKFSRGAKIFLGALRSPCIQQSFKIYPTKFQKKSNKFSRGAKIFLGGLRSPCNPWLRAALCLQYVHHFELRH